MRWLKYAVLGVFLAGAGYLFADGQPALALSRGPFLEHTGAPGEQTCQTVCHRTYALNSGLGHVEIAGLPAQYAPGATYPVTVRVSDPKASRWGFEITAVADDGTDGGSFSNNQDLKVQALGPSIKLKRFYAEHTELGTYQGQAGGAEWTLSWKAPAEDKGPITLYAAGNAANSDHTDFYDYIYTTSATVESLRRTVRVTLASPS